MPTCDCEEPPCGNHAASVQLGTGTTTETTPTTTAASTHPNVLRQAVRPHAPVDLDDVIELDERGPPRDHLEDAHAERIDVDARAVACRAVGAGKRTARWRRIDVVVVVSCGMVQS